ncbi:MAG TPA: ABC transporter substrate-binding protein, partial [Thermodesulfobacteriota bacterium]|nr:ABC transporter substrate-binding protein [Thermodesulfobacteriota bacterium]
MRTWALRGIVIFSLLFLLGGPVFGADPIKIGVVYPLTGPAAAAGTYQKAGVEIARDKMNSEGGIIGRQVTLFVEDGANDPAQSVSAAEKLVTRDKVDAMIAAWGSSPTLAVSASVTKKYGVPHVVDTASSVKVTLLDGKRPNPWLFRTSPTSRMEAQGLEKVLVPKMGFSKVAFMAVNNDWGRGAAEEFGTVIKKTGGSVVTTEIINADATDFLTQLTKIKNSEANAIIVTTDQAQVALILKQYKQLGLTQKILTTGGGIVPEGLVLLSGPEAAEGVNIITFFAPWFPEMSKNAQEAKWFSDEYLKRGHAAKGFGECFRGYDGMKAVKAAI